MRTRDVIGYLVSAIWIAIVGAATYCFAWEKVSDFGPAEWSAIVAAISSPLALLWFVLGYRQQAEEIRENTSAVQNQHIQLQNQVSQLKKLVEATNRHADAYEQLLGIEIKTRAEEEEKRIKEAQPLFEIKRRDFQRGRYMTYSIQNRGAEARNLDVKYDGPHHLKLGGNRIRKDEEIHLIVDISKNKPLLRNAVFDIEYNDALGKKRTTSFVFKDEGWSLVEELLSGDD